MFTPRPSAPWRHDPSFGSGEESEEGGEEGGKLASNENKLHPARAGLL